eukprot:scaffold13227_cov117-Isochrysis_galbana.AAC.15
MRAAPHAYERKLARPLPLAWHAGAPQSPRAPPPTRAAFALPAPGASPPAPCAPPAVQRGRARRPVDSWRQRIGRACASRGLSPETRGRGVA